MVTHALNMVDAAEMMAASNPFASGTLATTPKGIVLQPKAPPHVTIPF